jgi:uncharacterized membrane protein
MAGDPLDQAASAARLRAVRRAGLLDAAGYERALALAGVTPDPAGWRRFLDRLLLAFGITLLLAGVVFFFAWNWADMSRFGKFAVIEAALLLVVFIAWRTGLDSRAGRGALTAAAFLPGVLLAVYGQAYQTGADPYGLFALWALLILPWALIGRSAALWLLWLVLAELAVMLWWGEVWRPRPEWEGQLARELGPVVWLMYLFTDAALAETVFLINALAIVVWEWAARRGISWMDGRLLPRIAATLAVCALTIPVMVFIFAQQRDTAETLAPFLYLTAGGLGLWMFRERARDLYALTVILLSAIVVVTAFFIRQLHDAGGMLFISLLVVGLSAAAAAWLRGTVRAWEGRE